MKLEKLVEKKLEKLVVIMKISFQDVTGQTNYCNKVNLGQVISGT